MAALHEILAIQINSIHVRIKNIERKNCIPGTPVILDSFSIAGVPLALLILRTLKYCNLRRNSLACPHMVSAKSPQ
eukprot:3971835-Ditylum_brightwellii.AAC.1